MLSFLFFLSSFSNSAAYKPPVLDDETFYPKINKSKLALVLAIDDNNTASDVAIPHFRAAASYFSKDRKCDFLILDGTKSPNVTEELDIRFFPSFYLFRNGKKILEYTGKRNATDLAKFVKRISDKPVIEITEQKQAYDFLRTNPISVVLQGDDDMDPDVLDTFEKVAEQLYDFIPFVYASTDIAAYQFGLQPDQDSSVTSSIILRRQIDDTFLTYDRDSIIAEPDSFEQFVRDNMNPLYRTADGTVFRDIIHDTRWTLFCFLDTARKSGMKQVHSGFREVIEKYGNNFTYFYGNIRDYIPLLNSIGISGKNEPVWMYANFSEDGEISDKVFLPEGTELQPGLITRFTDQVVNGYNAIPIKSEPIPEENETDNQPLQKLVGQTFKSVYLNNKDKVILVINGSSSLSVQFYNSMSAIAAEFDQQGCRTIDFYFIDHSKNDLPLTFPEEVSIIVTRKGQSGLCHLEKDPLKLMKLLIQELNPSPKVKIPKKLKVKELMKAEEQTQEEVATEL